MVEAEQFIDESRTFVPDFCLALSGVVVGDQRGV